MDVGLLNGLMEACELVRQECRGLAVDVDAIVPDQETRNALVALLGAAGPQTGNPLTLALTVPVFAQRLCGMTHVTDLNALSDKGVSGISASRSRVLMSVDRQVDYIILGLEPCSAVPAHGCSALRIIQHYVEAFGDVKEVRVRLFTNRNRRPDQCDTMTELIDVLAPPPDAATEFGTMWRQDDGARVPAAPLALAEVVAPPSDSQPGLPAAKISRLTMLIDVFRTEDFPQPLAFEAEGWAPDAVEPWVSHGVLTHPWNPAYQRASLRLPKQCTPRLLPMDHNNIDTVITNRKQAITASYFLEKRTVAVVYWPNAAKWPCLCVVGDPQQAGQRVLEPTAVIRCFAKEVWQTQQATRLRLVFVPPWLPDDLPSPGMLGLVRPDEVLFVVDARRFDGWPVQPYRQRFLVAQTATAGNPVVVTEPPIIKEGFSVRQTFMAPLCGLGNTVPGWPFTEWTKSEIEGMNFVVKLYRDTTLQNAYLLDMSGVRPSPEFHKPKPTDRPERSTPTFWEYVLTLLRCCVWRLDGPRQRIGLVLPRPADGTWMHTYVRDLCRLLTDEWGAWRCSAVGAVAPNAPVKVVDLSPGLGAAMAENRLTIVFRWPSMPKEQQNQPQHWIRERVEHHPWLCSELTQAMLRTQTGSLMMGDVGVFNLLPDDSEAIDVPGFPLAFACSPASDGALPAAIVFHRNSVDDGELLNERSGVPLLSLGYVAHTDVAALLERVQAATGSAPRRKFVRTDVFEDTPLPLKLPDDDSTTLLVFDWRDGLRLPVFGWRENSHGYRLRFSSSVLQKAGVLPVVV